MHRITITEPDEDEYGHQTQRIVGWFDLDRAERFEERREATDGTHLAGVHCRDHNGGQELYRTAGGRWVLNEWSAWQNVPDRWRYITDEEAAEWLIVNGESDETMARLFGAAPEHERGPGRPEIGPAILVRMPREMIARLEEEAERAYLPRAEVIRRMLARQLSVEETGTDGAA